MGCNLITPEDLAWLDRRRPLGAVQCSDFGAPMLRASGLSGGGGAGGSKRLNRTLRVTRL